ncbi:MAG: toll/interleukin-1 receptor domain-containing protein [Roseiarcus sp.]
MNKDERQLGNVLPEHADDIFICFSSKDEAVALEVVQFLEARKLKCWISVRDVPPGHNYQETIVKALEGAKGLVFLFSDHSSASGETKKELSLAGTFNMPVFPLRLSPILPSGALRYELATRQWIDLFPDREKALRRLAATIRTVLGGRAPAEYDGEGAAPIAGAPPDMVDSAPAALEAPPIARRRARAARPPIVATGSAEFEALRASLARHIGPIAKVLLQKAASEARTPDDLCERLAAYVSAPSDRAAFLQAARARLAARP